VATLLLQLAGAQSNCIWLLASEHAQQDVRRPNDGRSRALKLLPAFQPLTLCSSCGV